MKEMRVLAISALAGALLGFPSAQKASAADLGGDCCTDLEERVAELEATTARKGNRKVSLTISGWVARELYAWDDGDMSDAYVVDPSTTLATHFKLSGVGEIKPGWRAGFVIHIEEADNGSLFVNQLDDGDLSTPDGDTGLNTLEVKWYVESDRLGRVTVGQQSQASDNTAILADFSGSLVQSNWVLFDGAGFFLRPSNSGRRGVDGLEQNGFSPAAGTFIGNTWGNSLGFCATSGLGIGGDCNGVPLDAVRYDTPSIYGFIFSADWGENDFWDVAVNYQAEWNSIKFKAAAAYNWYGDNKANAFLFDEGTAGFANRNASGSFFQIGAMAMHTPTGLFLYGAYGTEDPDQRFINVDASTGFDTLQKVGDDDMWFAKAGIRRNWTGFGATVLYGEYGKYNDMFGGFDCNNAAVVGTSKIGAACLDGPIHISSSELTRWGAGIVQEIDSASLSLYAKFVQLDGEINFRDTYEDRRTQDYDRLNNFIVGGLINF
jgi:hypothetical protein